ncbi:hypothetical protein HPB52_025403 [Rhipicephalus sanguineus]|uniref:Uncharacterized protein n=1 Tax=Rhipicephalus sanguineus TaxID=34632 RepID=A0A9D4TD37_RHISA|nr:hypothetical protein HPB52_025403 [Rhipicephalus sanguineus]
MTTRRQIHAVSWSVTPSPVPASTPADPDEFSLEGDDVLGRLQSLADDADPARAAASSRNDPGDPGEEDDAASSVSDATAVVPGLATDIGSRVQRRARESEDELSRYMSESSNKVPVSARNFIMSRVFELVASCADLRVEAASERGAALALRGQLIEARREMAAMQRTDPGASSGSGAIPGRVAGPCCSGVPGAPSAMPPGVPSYAAALTGVHCGALPSHGAQNIDPDAPTPTLGAPARGVPHACRTGHDACAGCPTSPEDQHRPGVQRHRGRDPPPHEGVNPEDKTLLPMRLVVEDLGSDFIQLLVDIAYHIPLHDLVGPHNVADVLDLSEKLKLSQLRSHCVEVWSATFNRRAA